LEEGEVEHALSKLSSKCTTGWDGIPECILKKAIATLIPHLTILFNLIIAEKKLPLDWKVSIVTPLHKAGPKDDVSNYRPVSILSPLLRTFERCLAEQIKEHLTTIKFLSDSQFGFRRYHSTDTCLCKLTEDWRRARARGETVVAVSIDMSKAFDTIHVDGLMKSLESAGFDADSMELMKHYLTNRQQCTKINNCLSSQTEINYGVPQGSVLGPLLFTMYINEMSTVPLKSSIVQYADDTTIYFSSKSIETIRAVLQKDLDLVCSWLAANSLKVNGKKSQLMILALHTHHPTIDLTIESIPLTASKTMTILGFTLDNKLLMTEQIKVIRSKARKGLWALKMASKYLGKNTLKIMANGIVFSHLQYCDNVLAQASDSNLQKLQSCQDKAVRIIMHKDNLANPIPLRQDLGWLDLAGKQQVHLATLIWRCLNNEAPNSIKNLFCQFEQRRFTRLNVTLKIPVVTKLFMQMTLAYRGAVFWNSLPTEIKETSSAQHCRQLTYQFLLDKTFKIT
jgi:hypothetical protein